MIKPLATLLDRWLSAWVWLGMAGEQCQRERCHVSLLADTGGGAYISSGKEVFTGPNSGSHCLHNFPHNSYTY